MTLRKTTAALLVLAAAAAAGCGSDEEKGRPLPQQAVVDLDSRLNEVERRIAAGGGACADIQNDTAPAVNSIISSLPDDVDADVRQALQDGFDRLFALSEEQCDSTEEQPTTPEPPPETDTVPETVTETVPTIPDTDTETIPTIPEEPPVEPVPPEGNTDTGDGGALIPEEDGE